MIYSSFYQYFYKYEVFCHISLNNTRSENEKVIVFLMLYTAQHATLIHSSFFRLMKKVKRAV